jgi:hypothetical protein
MIEVKPLEFKAVLITAVSKKSGGEYKRLDIHISPTYIKKVFKIEDSVKALLGISGVKEFRAVVSTGIGKESGKEYTCLDIHYDPDCVEKVFLDKAELAIIKRMQAA